MKMALHNQSIHKTVQWNLELT